MNKLIPVSFRVSLAVFLSLATSSITKAQSLPNVQKENVRVPDNMKVDGKATEWGDKFQAYNKATDVYYTLSNDDNNLYLTIQAKYHDVVDKILRGGMTLTINHTLAKRDNDHIAVTYPVLEGADIFAVSNMFARKSMPQRDDEKVNISVDELNKLLNAKSKVIKVSGIKAIIDESLSVYNEEGIKAASQFDSQNAYTYELAIPLKYLTLPNNGADGFSYNIKIHEPSEKPVPHGPGSPPPPPIAMTAASPTDFWGEYTLAKK